MLSSLVGLAQQAIDTTRCATLRVTAGLPSHLQLEGPCLVVLKDGTVAQSFIRDGDFRCCCALASLLSVQAVVTFDRSSWFSDIVLEK
jgi:hypothetical protein